MKYRRLRCIPAAFSAQPSFIATCLGILPLVFASAAYAGAGPQRLHGHVPPPVAAGARATGRLPGTKQLNFSIGLPLRNHGALSNFLSELNDPSSANYHRYLTSAETREQFSPTEEDYQALIQFVTSNGLTVRATHANRLLLNVSGTVADVERVLHINLRTYRHPTEQRDFFAPDTEPSLDTSVPVLDVSGLDDFVLPRPLVHKNKVVSPTDSPTPNAGSGPSGLYMGNDFRAAYMPGVSQTGSNQIVALLEFDGYNTSDVTSYFSQAGLPNVTLQNILLDNFGGGAGQNNIEVALDIDMAVAMAPGLSKVMVYEGQLGNTILSQIESDNQAKQVSASWSFGINATTEQLFQLLISHGQTYFNASGDSGAYTGTVPTPCDDPNVISVGATTLFTTGPGGSYVSESVWNWFTTGAGSAASSGGVSTAYSIPSWQQGVDMSGNQGSTTKRNLPDVALTGDGIYVIADGGVHYSVGGTSAAAPLWAGFTALVNQREAELGLPVVGFINPALYALAKSSRYSSVFRDVTSGSNTNGSTQSKFFATPGFDLCTGWGSPNGNNMINALTGPILLAGNSALTSETCLPTNGAVDPGETVTMSFSLQNVGVVNSSNLVATLQSSGGVSLPSGPQTYGALVAGSAAVSRSFTFTANGACGGRVTAGLQLQDGTKDLGIIFFKVPLGAAVPATTFTQNFDGVTAPALPAGWTSTSSGSESPWVTSTGASSSAPNGAFVSEPSSVGLSDLISPVIPIVLPTAQLTFRNNYNLQSGVGSSARDGGVLEIAIGGGGFTDILAAGGSFAAGGYVRTISSTHGSQLAGRQCWSGNAGGFITSTVNLPASAAGQNVQFRWRCATDNSTAGTGWYIDSISLADAVLTCCGGASADLAVSQTASTNPAVTGHNLTYNITLTNIGPTTATSVTVTDALPVGVSLISASPGGTVFGGTVLWSVGTLANGGSTNVSVTVSPTNAGLITNIVSSGSGVADPNLVNNSANLITSVDSPVLITSQPTNRTVLAGATVSFQVSATGAPSPGYQWFFNGTNLPGANASTLTLTNVQPAQAGGYMVTISNAVSTSNSATATLTIQVLPVITSQPSNRTVLAGTNVSFQVTATGTPSPGYQWFFNGTNLPGENSSTLTLTNVQLAQTGGYVAVVSNAAGTTNSVTATLTVQVPPVITSQPTNLTVLAGSNVNFQVTATGTPPPGYQWFFNGTNLSAATSNLLALTNVQAAQAGDYTVTVTNAAGTTNSAAAHLTVLVSPTIGSIVVAGSNVTINVDSLTGLNYTLEFKNSFDDATWTSLPPAVPGTGAVIGLQDTNAPAVGRFYRVRAE